jgi:hypothetical protein
MSTFENRRWLVIPSDIVDTIDFTQVLESSPESLRYSIDGSKTFIKYEINEVLEPTTNTFVNPETLEETSYTIEAGIYGRPSIYSEEYPEYNHQEILDLLSTEEWTQPIEEIKE